MRIALERNAIIGGIVYLAITLQKVEGKFVEVPTLVEIESADALNAAYEAFDAMHPSASTLVAPALIAGRVYQTGETVNCASQAVLDQGYKDYAKQVTRLNIAATAGDTLSLLGTTSDAVQLLILMECVRADALAKATTFDEYKAGCKTGLDALMQSTDSLNELGAFCAEFVGKVAAKEVVLPYAVKYQVNQIASVFADVATRATLTSQTLLS